MGWVDQGWVDKGWVDHLNSKRSTSSMKAPLIIGMISMSFVFPAASSALK
jgi:hypothetical protein